MEPYYDCPIEAAYMAKNFGMIFKWHGGQSYTSDGVDLILYSMSFYDDFSIKNAADKYYIVPESHALLQPQVGDLVTHLGVMAWWVVRVEGDKLIFANNEFGSAKEMKIIQRNNLPFISPKREVVGE